MKGKKLLSLLLAASLVTLVACGGKDKVEKSGSKIKEGGTIVFAAGGDPRVLNPMYGNDRVTMTINNALYSPLFIKEDGKFKYYLGENLDISKDFLTYTLKLKKDLKWHDGKPITSDDIVFTLDKIMDKSQNSLLRGSFVIDGTPVEYKKVDDLTVEFKLPKVSMSFDSSLAGFSPIPKHIFEGETDIAKSKKNESPIGSGPYKFEGAKKGESVTLAKNTDYFDEKPHIDKVVYRVLADANSSNSALLNGEISAKYLEPKDVDKFKEKTNVVTFNEGMVNNLIMNFNNDLLKKKEVRQAIAYALDKNEIIKGGYLSTEFAEPAYSAIAPTTQYYSSDVEKYDFNLDKAKELMNKAGVKEGKLKLAFINGKKDQEAEALIMQQKLKEIGLEIEFVPMERNAFYKLFDNPKENKTFDLGFNGYVMGNDSNAYKSIFKSEDSNNMSNYVNKELDELWEKANVETDEVKREALYKDIQKRVSDELPIYPIAYPKSVVAIDKKIGGIEEAKPAPIFMFRDLSKLYFTE